MLDDTAGQHLASTLRCSFGGASVQDHADIRGFIERQALPDQAGNDAGQRVAHAGRGHGRRAEGTQRDPAVRRADQRAEALENDHGSVPAGQFAHRREAIALNLGGVDAQQASGLTGVRRQDPVTSLLPMLRQPIQAVGIEHERLLASDQPVPHGIRPVRASQSGPQRDDIGTRNQCVKALAVFAIGPHGLGQPGGQRGGVLDPGGHGDEPRAGLQRGSCGQQRRPGHPVITTDDQYVAEVALVGGRTARRQKTCRSFRVEQNRVHFLALERCVGNIQSSQRHRPRPVAGRAGQQTPLDRDEGDGCIGTDGDSHRLSGIRIQTRRDVERQDRRGTAVDRLEPSRDVLANLLIEAGAEYPIDDEVGPGESRIEFIRAMHGPARLMPGRPCFASFALQPLRIGQSDQVHIETGGAGFPGHDIAIAAVVTAPADHDDPACVREATAQRLERRAAGALHQLETGDAELFDRVRVDRPALIGPIYSVSMSHGSDYTSRPGADEGRDVADLKREIQAWGRELGFQQVGISDLGLDEAEADLEAWLAEGRHGEMEWMVRHGRKRSRPAELVPGTKSVVTVRMDYLPEAATDPLKLASMTDRACISRYALGRDYHKVMRGRLKKLAGRIEDAVGAFGHRVFTDSAPVLEKPLAAKAGLGWIGKHTNLLNRHAGSWFFLGEIYTDLALEPDSPVRDHCGSCRRCIDICPTDAITAPYQLDARRCISYLTIELKGAIPVEFRKAIGNRVYGCDDCQAVCPWNRYAQFSREDDFRPRDGLDAPRLVDLFGWDEEEFLSRTEGSAIRRIGHDRWLRNLAVGLGNAPTSNEVIRALRARSDHPAEMVREHVAWALEQHDASCG